MECYEILPEVQKNKLFLNKWCKKQKLELFPAKYDTLERNKRLIDDFP